MIFIVKPKSNSPSNPVESSIDPGYQKYRAILFKQLSANYLNSHCKIN